MASFYLFSLEAFFSFIHVLREYHEYWLNEEADEFDIWPTESKYYTHYPVSLTL